MNIPQWFGSLNASFGHQLLGDDDEDSSSQYYFSVCSSADTSGDRFSDEHGGLHYIEDSENDDDDSDTSSERADFTNKLNAYIAKSKVGAKPPSPSISSGDSFDDDEHDQPLPPIWESTPVDYKYPSAGDTGIDATGNIPFGSARSLGGVGFGPGGAIQLDTGQLSGQQPLHMQAWEELPPFPAQAEPSPAATHERKSSLKRPKHTSSSSHKQVNLVTGSLRNVHRPSTIEEEEDDSQNSQQPSASAAAAAASASRTEYLNSISHKRDLCVFAHLVAFVVAMAIGITLTIKLGLGRGIYTVTPEDTEEPTHSPSFLNTFENTQQLNIDVSTLMPTLIWTTMPTATPSIQSTTSSTTVPEPSRYPSYKYTESPSPRPQPTPPSPVVPATLPPNAADLWTWKEVELFERLKNQSFDGGKAMITPDTPQYRALTWLANDPNYELYEQKKTIQRYALATFYYSTSTYDTMTHGTEAWMINDGWLSTDDECTWYTSSNGDSCDDSGIFIRLELDFNDLGGTIPAEIALLSNLVKIQIHGGPIHFLTGTLPTEVGLLTDLEWFSVRGNSLTGTLPGHLGKWTALNQLNAAFNNFEGTLPTELGSLKSNLTELFLEENNFYGSLPTEIGQLRELERLSLSNNWFSGPIPSEIGLLSDNLKMLNLEMNQFTDRLPTEIGQLEQLNTFALHTNRVVGPLPTEIGNLMALRSLLLHSNQFIGEIPSQIGAVGQQDMLVTLDLSENRLSGTIPSEIGLLSLRVLLLQSNQLTGLIPTEIAKLSRLNMFRVDENDISGMVPPEVCDVFFDTYPVFYSDCVTEVICPCCTYCCLQVDDEYECICAYDGTDMDFLC